jgi:hypothetical protein
MARVTASAARFAGRRLAARDSTRFADTEIAGRGLAGESNSRSVCDRDRCHRAIAGNLRLYQRMADGSVFYPGVT